MITSSILAAFLLLAPLQFSYSKSARRFLKSWRSGAVELAFPTPLHKPQFLDKDSKRIAELIKARGRNFYWCSEYELSMICSGLAADVSGAGIPLLFDLALARFAAKPEGELKSRGAIRKQPWMLRHAALAAMGRFREPQISERARALIRDEPQGKFPALAPIVGLEILGSHGELEDQYLAIKSLKHEDPLIRAAAVQAAGAIAGKRALESLAQLLGSEQDLGVRCHLWSALAPFFVDRKNSRQKDESTAFGKILSQAGSLLQDPRRALAERLSICRFLWQSKPKASKRALVAALATVQGQGVGKALLRWWIHNLLIEIVGKGLGRARRTHDSTADAEERRGNEPDLAANDVEGWQKLLESGGYQGIRTQLRSGMRPPTPKTKAMLFKRMPVIGERILFLLDNSDVAKRPWALLNNTIVSTEDRKLDVGQIASREILRAVEKLVQGTQIRIVAYGQPMRYFPRKGYASSDKKLYPRLAAFFRSLAPDGEANPSKSLLDALGIRNALPLILARPRPDAPDHIYWLPSAIPDAGPLQSPKALADVIASATKSNPLPVSILYVLPQRRGTRAGSPARRLGRYNVRKNFLRVTSSTGGWYLSVSSSTRRR